MLHVHFSTSIGECVVLLAYLLPLINIWNARWVSLRLEALSWLITACLATILVYGGHGKASTTGFALNMAGTIDSLYLLRKVANPSS